MGGLNPALEALAQKLTPGVSCDRRPARLTPSPGEASESGGDLITVGLDLTKILAMPLDQFTREGQLLEVRVRWLDVTLWFVPDERHAEALWREGVSRGRVWTARELIALIALPDRIPATVQGLALAKRAIDGDIVDARPREPSGRSGSLVPEAAQ